MRFPISGTVRGIRSQSECVCVEDAVSIRHGQCCHFRRHSVRTGIARKLAPVLPHPARYLVYIHQPWPKRSGGAQGGACVIRSSKFEFRCCRTLATAGLAKRASGHRWHSSELRTGRGRKVGSDPSKLPPRAHGGSGDHLRSAHAPTTPLVIRIRVLSTAKRRIGPSESSSSSAALTCVFQIS